MRQGDFIRVFGAFAAAGAGAGLALAGAALTGNLGGATTIEQFTPTSAAPPSPGSASSSGDLSVQEIYRLDAPGVVQITEHPAAQSSAVASTGQLGSGFVIDKAGHIVTSARVISGANNLQVSFSGDDPLDATVVGRDPSTDVAVLQVDAHSRSLSPLPLGDSDQVQVGDAVVAIGNSISLSRTETLGIVSAVQHGVDAPNGAPNVARAIQTDAAIDHANTGGPLIDAHGEVIGVSSQVGDSAGAANGAGTGFAIPIDIVKTVVAQLLQSGTVQHPFLGIEAVPVSETLARAFNLPCDYGLLVQSVTPGTGAAGAGLRAGRSRSWCSPGSPTASAATSSSRPTASRSPARHSSGRRSSP